MLLRTPAEWNAAAATRSQRPKPNDMCFAVHTHTHDSRQNASASSGIAEINAKTVMAKELVENGVHCVAVLFIGVCRVSCVFGAPNFVDEKVSRVFFNFSFNELIYACMHFHPTRAS